MPARRRELTSSPTTRFMLLTSVRMEDTYFHEDCTQTTWSSSPMPIVEGLLTLSCNPAWERALKPESGWVLLKTHPLSSLARLPNCPLTTQSTRSIDISKRNF